VLERLYAIPGRLHAVVSRRHAVVERSGRFRSRPGTQSLRRVTNPRAIQRYGCVWVAG
jgi:hypothetical protein